VFVYVYVYAYAYVYVCVCVIFRVVVTRALMGDLNSMQVFVKRALRLVALHFKMLHSVWEEITILQKVNPKP
jgi:hypothetical protein